MLSDCIIVLDLDATLVNSFDETDAIFHLIQDGDSEVNYLSHQSYHLECKQSHTRPFNLWGIFRPHLEEFILYCIENFKAVYIWSAGIDVYVDAVVEKIFQNIGYQPPVILTSDDTVFDGDCVCKPLQKIFERSDGQANETNTLMVDDRSDVFSKNPDNGILIPRFSFDDRCVKEDGLEKTLEIIQRDIQTDNSLQELIKWFEINKYVEDVRTLDKDIFTFACNESLPPKPSPCS